MKLRYFFNLNQLTIKHFLCFGFLFFIMMSLVITVPNFDLRIYSPLKEANIVNYQKEILHIFIQKEEFLRICINDNGSGVNPNEFEKIFTPFIA